MVKNLPSYILVFKCSFWKINYVNNFWKNVKFKLFIYSVYTPLHDVNQSKVINLTMNPEVLWKVNYGNFSSHPSARPSYHLSSFVVGCNLFLNFDFDFQRSSGWEWLSKKCFCVLRDSVVLYFLLPLRTQKIHCSVNNYCQHRRKKQISWCHCNVAFCHRHCQSIYNIIIDYYL